MSVPLTGALWCMTCQFSRGGWYKQMISYPDVKVLLSVYGQRETLLATILNLEYKLFFLTVTVMLERPTTK